MSYNLSKPSEQPGHFPLPMSSGAGAKTSAPGTPLAPPPQALDFRF